MPRWAERGSRCRPAAQESPDIRLFCHFGRVATPDKRQERLISGDSDDAREPTPARSRPGPQPAEAASRVSAWRTTAGSVVVHIGGRLALRNEP